MIICPYSWELQALLKVRLLQDLEETVSRTSRQREYLQNHKRDTEAKLKQKLLASCCPLCGFL